MNLPADFERALLLSKNEKAILKHFGTDETPLSLSEKTSIPRPTAYIALDRLKKRGLVAASKKGKKTYWNKLDIAFVQPENEKPMRSIRIYTDPKDIIELFEKFARDPKHRLKSLLGNKVGKPWREAIGEEPIVNANRSLKRNKIVTEVISSIECYRDHAEFFGKDWVDSYTGRPFKVSLFDPSYFDHAAQIFLHGPRTILVNMERKFAIEIHDAQIAKMMDSTFRLIQDQTVATNIEEKLREMLK
ncbi:MAG TPA: hypothetical protein VGE35_03530 [Candidatus Paceibacterota bacterium]